MLTCAEAFKQVLEVENTIEILDFAVPEIDVLLWPYIRFEILQKCVQALLSYEDVDPTDVVQENTSSRLKLFAKTAWHCFKPWPKRDIFLLNAAGSQYHKVYNEKLYNIYQEPYAEIFPKQTLYLDASEGPEFISSEKFALCRTAPISLLAGKMARYMSTKISENKIKSFVNFIKNRIYVVLNIEFEEDFYVKLQDKLVYLCKLLKAERILFKLFFPQKSPKLCIIQDAHYGGHGNIISFLKERGTIIAEDQHGVIASVHAAYNWATALLSDERLQKQLPDVFLSYGDYWHKFFSTPSKYHIMGNAWFDICQREMGNCNDGDAILLALNSDYDAFASMIPRIQKTFPNREIIIRPHPRQRDFLKTHSVALLPNVTIDTCQNIYETFQRSSMVVGTFSTSLFEAAALGKRTFIYENMYSSIFSKQYFEHFSNVDELIVKLQKPWTVPADVKDVFFDRNWKENYKKFAEQHLS